MTAAVYGYVNDIPDSRDLDWLGNLQMLEIQIGWESPDKPKN